MASSVPTGASVLSEIYGFKMRLERQVDDLEFKLSAIRQSRSQASLNLNIKLNAFAALRLQSTPRQGPHSRAAQKNEAAVKLLEQREAELGRLKSLYKTAAEICDERVKSLLQCGEELESVERRLQKSREQFRNKLARMEQWHQLNEAVQTARQRAQAIADRAAGLAAERTEKLQGFEQDPLFMFLKQRGYLTASYRSNRLTRALDNWIARLCNYVESTKAFNALTRLPDFAAEQATVWKAKAGSVERDLLVFEQAEEARIGFQEIVQQQELAREALQKAKAGVAQAKERLATHQKKLDDFSAGKDSLLLEAQRLMSEGMDFENIDQIIASARESTDERDDQLAGEIVELERISKNLLKQETLLDQQCSDCRMKANRLGRLIRKFKEQGFHLKGGFVAAFSLDDLLQPLLDGTNSESVVLKEFQRFYSVDYVAA